MKTIEEHNKRTTQTDGWKCPKCGDYNSTVPLGHSYNGLVHCWSCDNYFNPEGCDYR